MPSFGLDERGQESEPRSPGPQVLPLFNGGPNAAKRLGRVNEISAAVAFLASPLADYVNGANLRLDGGCLATVD